MNRYESKPFNTCATDGMGRLVQRVTDGLARTLYDQVDYDKVKSNVLEQRYSCHKSLMKLRKFEQVSKQTKENNLLKQHHLVWRKEFLRLNNARRRLEHELEDHIRENASTPDGNIARIYQEFDGYSSSLNAAFAKFKTDTVNPVWSLREDLQYWVKKNRSELEISSPDILAAGAKVKDTILSVKKQQGIVLAKLSNEEEAILQALDTGCLKDVSLAKRCPHVERGIPDEIFQQECPDQQLRVAVLQEFLWLDEKYDTRLTDLQLQHSNVLLSSEYDGWSETDHYTFTCIIDQYTSDIPNRRQLFIDRCRRHLPHKSRLQIVAHEAWHRAHQYYNDRRHAITSDWSRDKHELMTKAAVVFMEAALVYQHGDRKNEEAEKQRAYCKQLADKVSMWREMKAEAIALEEELERRRMEEVREEERILAGKEAEKRESIKQRIHKFKEEKNLAKRQADTKARERLEALQVIFAEQALHDNERVQYRIQEHKKKAEELKQKGVEREEQEREKEERLEALRSQVRVVAESDPVRAAQHTESWYHHIHPDLDKDLDIHKPLFDLHSFTSKQITSDNRVKLEGRLREAGLLESEYARQALAMVAPPHPPRKDTTSTIFKQT